MKNHSEKRNFSDAFRRFGTKSRVTSAPLNTSSRVQKKERFDFEKMKAAATSEDPAVRKAEFIEYFERFSEFPSFLFDNEHALDPRLAATMQDLSADEDASPLLLAGVKALQQRLPF